MSGRAHPVPRRMTAVTGTSISPGLMGGRLLREAQNFARAMAGRPERRPKDPSTSVQRTSATRVGEAATVAVVDDDPSVLGALSRLTQAAGFRVLTFDRQARLKTE